MFPISAVLYEQIIACIAISIFGAFGGFVRYIEKLEFSEDQTNFNKIRLLYNTIVSGFLTIICALILVHLEINPVLIFAICGLISFFSNEIIHPFKLILNNKKTTASQQSDEVRITSGADKILTPRELEILDYLSRGISNNKIIASKINLSPSAIGTHKYNIFKKLGVTSQHTQDDLRAALKRQKDQKLNNLA
jgi:DNA-binding CsgD family transcriptional regulator